MLYGKVLTSMPNFVCAGNHLSDLVESSYLPVLEPKWICPWWRVTRLCEQQRKHETAQHNQGGNLILL
jgi:hypothetical protein